MPSPTGTFLSLVTSSILAFSISAPLLAETLPERGCGMDRTAIRSAQHRDPVVPADVAACKVTVLFETGSAILVAEARRLLDQAAPEVIAHLAGGGIVRIDGYARPHGPEETAELSRQRARAVAAYLEAAWGIPPRRLMLRGWGSALADGREPPRTAENRRATLELVHGMPTAMGGRTLPTAPRVGHLDLDDFGGARNPLLGPVIRIWAAPRTRLRNN